MIDEKVLKLSLSNEDVAQRVEQGKVNFNADTKSKSIKRIVFDNTVTIFNGVNLFLLVLLILVGAYKHMLYMFVVAGNTIIGIVQEIRSKMAVDKLSIVVSGKIRVIRSGEIRSIKADDIVLDDIIVMNSGIQIPCDCEIVSGFCYANESLLTGESDLIEKREGDKLFSGSFVASGEVYAKVTSVGADNYAAKIQREAKINKKVNSEIMRTLNKIITYIAITIFPVGIALFVNQYFFNGAEIKNVVTTVVAALIGMIPQGLILLTSTVLAVAVIRLSLKKVLVQQLFCIETLARVDVLCLDKTGTITTGDLEVVEIIPLDFDKTEAEVILKSLARGSLDKNGTIKAIDDYINCDYMKALEVIPFVSEKKWSGAVLEDNMSYVLGAAEFVFNNSNKELFDKINSIDNTYRVVTLAKSDKSFNKGSSLPEGLVPIALVVIKDQIRDNASQTIKYFTEQGVQLKIISGDNNRTVERIAYSASVPDCENSVDATTLDTDEKIKEAAEKYTVFGRVTPQQKRKLIQALKDNDHTVAMTGDGVNDVLALKESDCSIAISSGSDAAKNVSHLVLVDNDFAHLPEVVAEGRRSINNIQRSASLFLVKTIYSVILALAFVFISYEYPFIPIQLVLPNAFLIGIPSFVLALQPNHNRIKGNFLKNIITRAWPGSLMVVANIFTLLFFTDKISYAEFSTLSVIMTSLVGFMLVVRISIPFNALRIALIAFIAVCLCVGYFFFGWLFEFTTIEGFSLMLLLILTPVTIVLYNVLYTLSLKLLKED